MKTRIAVLIFIGSTMLMRADQLVERVQQALKDQKAGAKPGAPQAAAAPSQDEVVDH